MSDPATPDRAPREGTAWAAEFVTEAREHLTRAETALLGLEKRTSPEEIGELVANLFRAFHTVKGGAGMLGFRRIEQLAHTVESLLELHRQRATRPDTAQLDALLAATDRLMSLLDDLEHSNVADVTVLVNRLGRLILDAGGKFEPLDAPAAPAAATPASPAAAAPAAPAAAAPAAPAAATPAAPAAATPAAPAVPVSAPPAAPPPTPPPPKPAPAAPARTVYKLTADLAELSARTGVGPVAFFESLAARAKILDAAVEPTGDATVTLPAGPVRYSALVETELPLAQLADELGLDVSQLSAVASAPASSAPPTPPASSAPPTPPASSAPPTPPASSAPPTPKAKTPPPARLAGAPAAAPLPAKPTRSTVLSPAAPAALAAPSAEPTDAPQPPIQRLVGSKPTSKLTNEPTGELARRDAGSATIRIGVELLDRLMTLAGELVLVRNQSLVAVSPDDVKMRRIVQRLNLVTTDLQLAILKTRMQPVGNLFNKFPRIVRDMGRELGKQIELVVAGKDTELDKTILESLSDPMTHLIRNSCDHGLEPPEVRTSAGKPPVGRITLTARHEGGHIVIEVRDDGRGIDPQAIRRKALEKGLKTEAEVAAMGRNELLSIILLPGFSTAQTVTDISGRGVGMDVVKTNVEQLGGSLEIDSTVGVGTTMTLRLPLTLAIIPSLIVKVGPERFALPQKNLVEVVSLGGQVSGGRIESAFDQEVYRLRDRLLPVVRMTELLARRRPFDPSAWAEILSRYHGNEARATTASAAAAGKANPLSYLAVVRAGTRQFGLAVDDILGTEEIVVKPMQATMKSLQCFSGATIMGDGRIALILDMEGISRHAGISWEGAEEAKRPALRGGANETQDFLLFRCGPDEQFALSLQQIRRIEHIRAGDIQRVGDREFVTPEGSVPTGVLRLDRLLRVSPYAVAEQMFLVLPKHVKRPVGLLASHIVDTVALPSGLATEGFREPGVLGSAMVRGRMTLFLEVFALAERAAEQAGLPTLGGGRPSRSKILVIDDSAFFRSLVGGFFEAAGYEVVTADDGRAGLTKLDAGRFDVVVSDIEMPAMNGWAFAAEARGRYPDLPMVALTTLDKPADRERSHAAGFDRHEVKVNRDRLLATVRELLDHGRAGAPSDKSAALSSTEAPAAPPSAALRVSVSGAPGAAVLLRQEAAR